MFGEARLLELEDAHEGRQGRADTQEIETQQIEINHTEAMHAYAVVMCCESWTRSRSVLFWQA
jgi:hypothetical protein